MELIVNALIENGVQVAVSLVVALIGVAGTWLSLQIGKVKKLQTVQLATDEAKDAAITTVLELQQTVVDDLKAAAVDGKLTKEEIAKLKNDLISMSMAKLSDTSVKILTAAGVDISAIIAGAAETMVGQMKGTGKTTG
ncbi:MAG TPA: hypothetical protein IAB83_10865 [Candidatus Faecousia faecavium]|nr:hypothetical protein [Candidatus Faecousia faecavium]